MQGFQFPPAGFGPGSQPEEAEKVEWMPMPSGMATYEPRLPETDDVEAEAIPPALEALGRAADACARVAKEGGVEVLTLDHLSPAARLIVAQTMGEGEVAIRVHDIPAVAIQESVFAGIWVCKGAGLDVIEVGAVPTQAITRAASPRISALGREAPKVPGVVNAPPLLVELNDKSAGFDPAAETHIINLTLLPHTEEDLAWLDAALGQGSVDILSRGYGNCRVTATALANVWRVQFFNSMDTLILDSFEVTGMPEVAIAAPEDLTDSGDRIVEVLEAIR